MSFSFMVLAHRSVCGVQPNQDGEGRESQQHRSRCSIGIGSQQVVTDGQCSRCRVSDRCKAINLDWSLWGAALICSREFILAAGRLYPLLFCPSPAPGASPAPCQAEAKPREITSSLHQIFLGALKTFSSAHSARPSVTVGHRLQLETKDPFFLLFLL